MGHAHFKGGVHHPGVTPLGTVLVFETGGNRSGGGGSMCGLSEGMQYVDVGQPRNLPAWALWFARLGREAADWGGSTTSTSLSVVVTVPARPFAAAFVALGAALASYRPGNENGVREHFKVLASVQQGTPVTWRQGAYLHCGEILGVEEIHGQQYLAMTGGYKRKWDMTSDIQVLGEAETPFVNRRKLCRNPEFVEAAVGVDPGERAMYSAADVVIVGIRAYLEEEISATPFQCARGNRPPKGTLQDLLRAHSIGNASEHYRSEIVSSFQNELPAFLRDGRVPVVVLDGASAVLRLRRAVSARARVSILDRSERASDAAAQALETDLAMSLEDVKLGAFSDLPPGIEIQAFEETA